MSLDSFFLDSVQHGPHVEGSYVVGLVMLSVFVSIFSSMMALQSARIAGRTQTLAYRHTAIGIGAISLGLGIWAMHFIGMLAFELPTHVHYSTGVTVISILPACGAAWVALHRLTQYSASKTSLLASGSIVGLGIGAMHYTGMAAMHTSLTMRYEPVMFGLSLVVAVALATLSLWIRYGVRKTSLGPRQRFYVAGVVMGLAIAGMHYTGMAAARFIGEPTAASNGLLLDSTVASIGLSFLTVTIAVMVVAVNGLIRSRELYQEVDEARARLRATLDTAIDGIITIDSMGLIHEFNPGAERLFGWTASEVIGKNIKMLMPEPDRSRHDDYLRSYLATGIRKVIGTDREVMGQRKNGCQVPLRLAVGRLDLAGELRFVGFVTDISERHALEASLRETAERAEQAAAAKSSFLANMSHEIRTPMNSIIGFTELLLQSDLVPAQRSYLNTIRQSSRSLLHLLNDILDTTKMEKGHMELEQAVFSLKALAMQVESSLRLGAQAKGLVLTTHYAAGMPEYFQGDPLRVLQILTNLVGNAIKFTEQGGVDVFFTHEEESIHIQVRDSGIGMTPEQIASIFIPFTQADASITRRFGGTGLGTTIARQLTDLMGGRIVAESELGQGSTFHVWLPLALASAPEQGRAHAKPVHALPRLCVLIADDIPQNLELLTLILQNQGHVVVAARDGSEAVERFKAGLFDVALMDVHMPVVDGLQATRLMRQHERETGRKRMPVIALTASVMAEDHRAALMAGMDGFAIKPLDVPRLFQEIAQVLGLSGQSSPTGKAPADSAVDLPAIDWIRGSALWGNEANFHAAVQGFLATAPEKYPVLAGVAGALGDSKQMAFSLHTLRGVSGNLALAAMAHRVGLMETGLQEGRYDEVRSMIGNPPTEAVESEVEFSH